MTRASANFFRLCGAEVIRGRTYTAGEDLPHTPKTAVLAYGFWRRHFGGDPQVIGKRLTLSGESYEIIGVVGRISKSKSMSHRMSIFRFSWIRSGTITAIILR
jgi:hypothetical protein